MDLPTSPRALNTILAEVDELLECAERCHALVRHGASAVAGVALAGYDPFNDAIWSGKFLLAKTRLPHLSDHLKEYEPPPIKHFLREELQQLANLVSDPLLSHEERGQYGKKAAAKIKEYHNAINAYEARLRALRPCVVEKLEEVQKLWHEIAVAGGYETPPQSTSLPSPMRQILGPQSGSGELANTDVNIEAELLSASAIAKLIRGRPATVETRLRRLRTKLPDCFREVEGRRMHEPKYLYRTADVLPELVDLRGSANDDRRSTDG
jgi:hypothetical protein